MLKTGFNRHNRRNCHPPQDQTHKCAADVKLPERVKWAVTLLIRSTPSDPSQPLNIESRWNFDKPLKSGDKPQKLRWLADKKRPIWSHHQPFFSCGKTAARFPPRRRTWPQTRSWLSFAVSSHHHQATHEPTEAKPDNRKIPTISTSIRRKNPANLLRCLIPILNSSPPSPFSN